MKEMQYFIFHKSDPQMVLRNGNNETLAFSTEDLAVEFLEKATADGFDSSESEVKGAIYFKGDDEVIKEDAKYEDCV